MTKNRRKPEGVYTSHSQGKKSDDLLFVRAKVNGVLSAAYVKNGELQSYIPWEEANREMYSGPCMVFNTEGAARQLQEETLIGVK